MKFVNIHEAKTSLSRLIKDAEQGEEVVIKPGFYDPLSAEDLELFYGGD